MANLDPASFGVVLARGGEHRIDTTIAGFERHVVDIVAWAWRSLITCGVGIVKFDSPYCFAGPAVRYLVQLRAGTHGEIDDALFIE